MMLCLILVVFSFESISSFTWLRPSSDSIVSANHTTGGIIGDATFSWRYQLQGGDQPDKLNVQCGYVATGGPELTQIISKFKQDGQIVKRSMNGRTEIISDPKDKGVIGFKLNRVVKTDPTSFYCMASNSGNDGAKSIYSKKITLNVLDRPKFKECLQNLKEVVEGKSLDYRCLVTGNPRPRLQCVLYGYLSNVLDQYPSSPAEQNVTGSQFSSISKLASYIVCTATAEETGSIVENKTITVYSTPFLILNVIQIASSESTSIRLRWNVTTKREAGNYVLLGYGIKWWLSSKYRENQNQTRRELKKPSDNRNKNPYYYADKEYVYYEMRGLDPAHTYSYRVFAYNSKGDGTVTNVQAFNPGYKGPNTEERSSSNDNLGPIIGGVIGGLVVLVLVVLLIVWLCRKKDTGKRYPTSYVDDAVDYPANQGNSLYAGVEKKPRQVSRSDSTSGYPDVVQNGDDYPMKNKASTSSYEQSNKVYL